MLYNIVVVFATHWLESAMGVHVSHQPKPPSHLPPYSIPPGCARAPALNALLHISNLHWSSILHLVIYKFQCHSPTSSYPHLLPHSPKSVLYICVSFAVLHIWLSLLSFYVPYICNNVLVFLFLAYFTMHNRLQFHPTH